MYRSVPAPCLALQVLELRLRQWLAAGRSCLIVGDLNISPAAIDSCHPAAEFDQQRVDRLWLNKLLAPAGGCAVDAFRLFHPSRYGAVRALWPLLCSRMSEQHNQGVDSRRHCCLIVTSRV
jgi:exonuclease III